MTAATDLLRSAASAMRERAEAATRGEWELFDDGIFVGRKPDPGFRGAIIYDTQVLEVGDEDYDDEFVTRSDAEHIASWSPPIALAVARWLEAEANVPEEDLGNGVTLGGPSIEAINVARTYLGRTA